MNENWHAGKDLRAFLLMNFGAAIVATIIGFCLLNFGMARAEIKAGPVIVHPGIEAEEVYRTNTYQTEKYEISDRITIISPLLSLDIPVKGRHEVHLGYSGFGYCYDRHSSQDHYDQILDGHMLLDFPGRLTTRLAGSITDATFEQTSGVDRERDYKDYKTGFDLGYTFAGRWRVKTLYQHDELIFEKKRDERENYDIDSMSAALQYRILPRTWALVQGVYTATLFENDSTADNDVYSAFFGLEWDPKGRLRGELKGGFAWKDYQNDLAGRNNSPENWSLQTELTWAVNRRTTLNLTALRRFVDDIDYQNESFTSTTFGLSLSRRIRPKITFRFYGNYQLNDYINMIEESATDDKKHREDEYASIGAGLRYNIQDWLFLSLNWNYVDKDSDFNEYSYHENRFGIKIGARY